MRHGIAGNKLSRNRSLRKATVRDIAKATIVHQRIQTTLAKAKEARKLVDKLITLGKKGTLADKRRAFAILCDHKLVSNLFNSTATRFKSRAGGYTRIIPVGTRRGDNAELAFLELTEKEEIIVSKPKTKSKTKKSNVEAPSAEKVKGEPAEAETAAVEKKETKRPKKQEKTEVSEAAKKKDVKSQKKGSVPKGKKDKGLFGGIKQIFQRKTGGGQ